MEVVQLGVRVAVLSSEAVEEVKKFGAALWATGRHAKIRSVGRTYREGWTAPSVIGPVAVQMVYQHRTG